MNKIIGLAIIGFGVFLEISWLGVCFGSVIIGVLLLIFAPNILFFPFNFFLVLGLSVIDKNKYNKSYSFKYSGRRSNHSSYVSTRNTLDEYYEILESSPEDSFEVIKKRYKKLIKEYHYDSIASKNLPEDMVKFAKEKTQKLNEAYAIIKGAI